MVKPSNILLAGEMAGGYAFSKKKEVLMLAKSESDSYFSLATKKIDHFKGIGSAYADRIQ